MSVLEVNACPLCGEAEGLQVQPGGGRVSVHCRRCGRFEVARTLLITRKATPRLAPYLSIYTRECTESGRAPEVLTPEDVEQLAQAFMDTPISRKQEKLLRLVEKRTKFPGAPAAFSPRWDYPLLHAVNEQEATYYRSALQGRGYLTVQGADSVIITPEGWEHLGPGSARGLPRRCFVAMSFDPSLEDAYAQGVKRGIIDAGHDPVRIDKIHHNEKICDKIVAEVRQAQFLVADVTYQRQGVYFEAGFGMALARPVIWLCREDDFPNVHFDTRQYNHIVWKNPEDLRELLQDRILATVGPPPP